MGVGPKFGSAGRSVRYSIDQSADRLDLINGFDMELYYRKLNDSRSETVEKLLCYGIAGREDAGNPFGETLTTVTWTQNEDVIMHESWEDGGELGQPRVPNTDEETQGGALVGVDVMLKIRAEERWTVAGYGKVPNKEATEVPWKVGDTVDADMEITSATKATFDLTETLAITIPAGAYLENVRAEGENTGFSTFSLEFVKYTPQATPENPFADIVAPPDNYQNAEVQFLKADYFYKTSRTTTLNAEGFGSVEETVELHQKHSTGALEPPVTP